MRMNYLSRFLRPAATAVAGVGLLMVSAPASAHLAAGYVQGTGTISPGLPESGCAFQEVSFDGTAIGVGNHTGFYDFAFLGNSSICETLGAGSGSGILAGDLTGTVTYSRTGSSVSLSGNVTIDGTAHQISSGACSFEPTSVQPVSTYVLECVLTVT